MIRTWVILVSGFTQGPGRANGTERLWRLLRRHSSEDTCVVTRVWDDDAAGFADFVARNSVTERPRILVAAYSWGAGHFFRRFAERLQELGRPIESAVLCDPVYRSRLLSFRWLALTRFPWITVPAGVRRVRWFRQRVNRPRGHDLVAEDPEGTRIAKPIELVRPHDEMDDARAYHELVIREVETVLGETTKEAMEREFDEEA